jgi:predicted ester cyclase/mannose-6-phosphate isomerase-like protein (cupin superfamily)
MNSDANRALAETFLRMLNEHDPNLVDEFVAVNYVNHNPFVADGREANREFWAAFFAALPDLEATMEDLVVTVDRVVGRLAYRGTHQGELFGIPASGRRIEMRSIDIWRVANGEFVEHWDELNTLQLIGQFGPLALIRAGLRFVRRRVFGLAAGRAPQTKRPPVVRRTLGSRTGSRPWEADVFNSGDELYDERFRERYVVLAAARETGGELVRIEDTAKPGPSRRPLSAHPGQEEHFGVLSGTLGPTVNGQERLLGAGESFIVPPGARHRPRNAATGELRFVAEMRPAGRFEEFLAEITAVNNSGRDGLAYLLTAAGVLVRFPDVEHPTPLPRPVERAAFAGLATIGRLVGLRPPLTNTSAD